MPKMLVFQEDPSLERHFKGHKGPVTSADFSPNNNQLGMLALLKKPTLLSLYATSCGFCEDWLMWFLWRLAHLPAQCHQDSVLIFLHVQSQVQWIQSSWSGTSTPRPRHWGLLDTVMPSQVSSFPPAVIWWFQHPKTKQFDCGHPACES